MSTTNKIDTLKNNPDEAVKAMTLSMVIILMFPSIEHFIDILWIQGLGDAAVSGVGYLSVLILIRSGMGRGTISGVSALLSRTIGEENKQKSNNYASQTIIFSVILGIILAVLFAVLMKPIVLILGGGPVLEYSMIYGLYYLIIGTPIYIISQAIIGLLRSEGSVKTNSIIMVCACSINMILNPFLIYTFGFGVAGSAISTLISDIFVFVVLGYLLLGKKSTHYSISFKKLNFKKSLFAKFIYYGLPAVSGYCVAAVFTSILTCMVTAVAGYMAVGVIVAGDKLIMLIVTPLIALSTTLLPVIGIQHGLKQYGVIHEIFIKNLKKNILYASIFAIGIYLTAPLITHIYMAFGLSVDIGIMVNYIQYMAITFPFVAITTLSINIFQGLGKGAHGSFISVLRYLISYVAFMYLFSEVLKWGINGIFTGIVVGVIVSSLISCFWTNYYLNILKNEQTS